MADVSSMSNTQLKSELKDLFGITDFSDCLEPADLQKKLSKIRSTQPITHGLRYGTLLQIGNREKPSGIVTLAHGLGDSAQGWEDVGHELAQRLPYLLFLLPTAPTRPVSVNGGMTMPAWYDIKSMAIMENLKNPSMQDAAGVKQSVDYITSLAHTTATRLRVQPSRIVYAGFSQGAAVSLVAGLTASIAPAGIASMSGYLPAVSDVLPRIRNTMMPVSFFHGRQDPVVQISAAKGSRDMLKEAGVGNTNFFEYNMEHSAVQEEIDELAKFLRMTLPESSL